MVKLNTVGRVASGGLLVLLATILLGLTWTPIKQQPSQPVVQTADHLPFGHYKTVYPIGNCTVSIYQDGKRQVFNTQETVITLERKGLHFNFPNIMFEHIEIDGDVMTSDVTLLRRSSLLRMASELPTRLRLLRLLSNKQVTIQNISRITGHYVSAERTDGCTYSFSHPSLISSVTSVQARGNVDPDFDFLSADHHNRVLKNLADRMNILLNLKASNTAPKLETNLLFLAGGLICLAVSILYFLPIRYAVGLVFLPNIIHGFWLLSPVTVMVSAAGFVLFPLVAHLSSRILLGICFMVLLIFAASLIFGVSRPYFDQGINLLMYLVIVTLLAKSWRRRA
jgi:hypothetical protein